MNDATGQNRPATTASSYRVSVGDIVYDREAVLHLWQGNLGGDDNLDEKYRWSYSENGLGSPLLLLLRHEPSNECIGVTSVAPRQFRVGNQQVSAGVLMDMVVDARHRTLYPAMLLQKQALDHELKRYSFLYGYPNRKAQPVFMRVGYTKLGDITRFVRILRTEAILGRFLPALLGRSLCTLLDRVLLLYHRIGGRCPAGWNMEWQEAPDYRFDQLWERTKTDDCIVGVRDSKFLQWRFVKHPGHRYRFFVLHAKDSDRLIGYLVCEATERTLCILDFLAESGDRGLRCLLDGFMNEAYRQGYVRVTAEYLGKESVTRALRRAGMVARGGRPVVFRSNHSLQTRISGLKWCLTSADEDQ